MGKEVVRRLSFRKGPRWLLEKTSVGVRRKVRLDLSGLVRWGRSSLDSYLTTG